MGKRDRLRRQAIINGTEDPFRGEKIPVILPEVKALLEADLGPYPDWKDEPAETEEEIKERIWH